MMEIHENSGRSDFIISAAQSFLLLFFDLNYQIKLPLNLRFDSLGFLFVVSFYFISSLK